MARTLLSPMVAYGPTSGAVSQPVPLDSTNGNMIVIDGPFVPQNVDKFGLYLVVLNSGTTGNIIVRGNVTSGGNASDLTTNVVGGTVAVIGSLAGYRYSNPLGDGHAGLWLDFSAASFAGTLMVVSGNLQTIPANTAITGQVKASAGALLAAVVTTLGTGIHTFYDNAMPFATGNTLGSFLASAAVGTMIAPNKPAAAGIVSAGVASGPALTAFYA